MALPKNWEQCLYTQSKTLIMGIVNVTTDSFSDGGKFLETNKAVAHALSLEQEGADIIDIGGESTRPGAMPVDLETELQRVLPVIEGIRSVSNISISIDTYKSNVAKRALDSGADLVNDISGLRFDEQTVHVVRDYKVPVVLMHMQGTPGNMQTNPFYTDLLKEVLGFFQERVEFCIRNGIEKKQIILDPGLGFGKRIEDNFELLRKLKHICDLGFPVLTGPSRKSFIGSTLNLPVNERTEGTAAAVTASVLNGAKIVRVHEVKTMKRVAAIADSIRGIS